MQFNIIWLIGWELTVPESWWKSIKYIFKLRWLLALSWRKFLSYRNQSTDVLCKPMDWFLYGRDFRLKGVNVIPKMNEYTASWKFLNNHQIEMLWSFQKQLSRLVLRKRCSENMQQIYRRTPAPKCERSCGSMKGLEGFFPKIWDLTPLQLSTMDYSFQPSRLQIFCTLGSILNCIIHVLYM